VYVGDWHEGKQCGFGTLTKSNGDVYEGEWLNGELGKHQSNECFVHENNLCTDKREGAGIYYYKSKEKIYDGEWVNDLPKCGVYTSAAEFFQEEKEGSNREPGSLRSRRRVEPIPEVCSFFSSPNLSKKQ